MPSAPERLTTALADRYRIERELGAGGMATVYLAHDVRHDRKVALKVLRPELSAILGADRFLAEIKTTANLQHPHILSLFDSGEAGGLVYYVMPYVEGESLRDRLTREKQLPVDDAIRIAREVADALEYAHQHGIVHRDIKPENILLHGGHAQVADFGIALAASRSEGGTRMTETGMSLGTPFYMAPEQAMGDRDITPRADVYALGVVLYEMLTGDPPFTGSTPQAVVARVLTETPRPMVPQRHTIPGYVEAAVLTALEKLPADRFATAAEFSTALGDTSFATVATRTRYSSARPLIRRSVLIPWALAVLALIAALGGWLSRPKPPGTSQQYIRLGDGTNVGEDIAFLNLSPDGSTIVFRDNSQNGRLWLKRRGALTPVVVPGTERANYPIFSPDGQWIAFIADGRLKKIRLDGGAAVTLADSALGGFGGVAWMGDGTLTFVGPQFGVISRVSVSGGAPAHVLDDTAVAGFGFGGLAPLPKGRGLLFTVCNSGCVTMAVHVLDLRTRAHHLVLDNVSKASYLPSGELLYIRRDGAALVAPFDLATLEISGAAVPVLEDVNVSSFLLANLAWSLNGTLVYVQGTGASNETELVQVDRRGNAILVDSAWHGDFNSFALALDGRRVAVGVGSVSGALSIWLRSLAPGPFTRLTFGGGDRRPAWSSDGRIVAYVHDTLNGSVVFARRVDGSGPEHLLARLDRQVQEVTWSPRGDWLVLRTDNGSAGAGDLVGIRTSGDTAPVSLVNSSYSEMHPAVSPDERWIAYVSNESGLNEVYVRPFPATNTARWQVSSGGGEGPRWSPDGRELYFAANNSVMAASLRVTPTFEVTGVHRLFDLPVAVYAWDTFHPSWNVLPNGQGFLMLRNRRSVKVQQVSRVVYMENWFADVRARIAH